MLWTAGGLVQRGVGEEGWLREARELELRFQEGQANYADHTGLRHTVSWGKKKVLTRGAWSPHAVSRPPHSPVPVPRLCAHGVCSCRPPPGRGG